MFDMKDPIQPYSDLCTQSDWAADVIRFDRAADTILKRIDIMVDAVADQDWTAVRWISRGLAQHARVEGFHAISAFAERVHRESTRPKNVLAIKRSMIRLLGIQGRISSDTAH